MIDSRDLLEKREDLKATILADHNEEFPRNEKDDFDDINFDNDYVESWAEDWEDDLERIEEINNLEREVGSSEFEFGVTLIEEGDFVDYCKELVTDLGVLPIELPFYIESNIDWEGVADDLKVDYSELEYEGNTYLFRV